MPGPWLATLRPVVRRAAVAAGDDERRPERVAKPLQRVHRRLVDHQAAAAAAGDLLRREIRPAPRRRRDVAPMGIRSEEHTSELQSLMRISYAVSCLKKNKDKRKT